MESIEKSLILKVGRFREVDAWLRLFSPRKGVFNAFAFGGSVSRRRFLGCLDPFNIVSFKVKTDAAKGYTFVAHQQEVGTGYFDDMTTVIQGGTSSVTALTGSTEEEQFH